MKTIFVLIFLTLHLFAVQTTFICTANYSTVDELMQYDKQKGEKFILNANSNSKPTSLTWLHSNGKVRAVFQTTQTQFDWLEAENSLFKIESNIAYITANFTKTAPYKLIIKALNKNTNYKSEIRADCVNLY